MGVSVDDIKKLRELTGVGLTDAKLLTNSETNRLRGRGRGRERERELRQHLAKPLCVTG